MLSKSGYTVPEMAYNTDVVYRMPAVQVRIRQALILREIRASTRTTTANAYIEEDRRDPRYRRKGTYPVYPYIAKDTFFDPEYDS